MNNYKVPFPKYLNAKRLFYKWEYDIILASVSISVIFFFYMLWFGVNILLDLLFSVIIFFFAFRYYKKFFKDKRKGWIWHKLYSLGMIKPVKKKEGVTKEDIKLIPFGFENSFSG